MSAQSENMEDEPVATLDLMTEDCGDESYDTPAQPEPVPEVLAHLYKNGMRFQTVSPIFWSTDETPKLVKRNSVYFSVDTIVSSHEILEAFDKAGIDISEIASVQRRASSRSWVVSFDSPITKEAALEIAAVEIGGVTVFLGDSENRVMIVKVYEAPAELPDTAIIGRLSHYGRVLSFRRDHVTDGVENGVRTARMRLHGNIPNLICLAGEMIRIWYPTQPKTCRSCGADDHLAKDCNSTRCFNCEKPGHVASECPSPPVCSLCLDDEHSLGDCPFIHFSANVAPSGGKKPEQEEVDKEEAKQSRQREKEEYAKQQVANPTRAKATNADKKSKDKGNKENKRSGDNKAENKESRRREDKGPDKQQHREDSDRETRRREDDRRDDDRRERRERREYEEWRSRQHRDRERDRERDRDRDRDRYREREHSRRDYPRDRSNRRDVSESDDDGEWTLVTSKHKRRYDYR